MRDRSGDNLGMANDKEREEHCELVRTIGCRLADIATMRRISARLDLEHNAKEEEARRAERLMNTAVEQLKKSYVKFEAATFENIEKAKKSFLGDN